MSRQASLLTADVFSGEAPPLFGMQVYVLVENVASLHVTTSFLTRWLGYTSSAFDIYSAGDIVMSPAPAPVVQSFKSSFAGTHAYARPISSDFCRLPVLWFKCTSVSDSHWSAGSRLDVRRYQTQWFTGLQPQMQWFWASKSEKYLILLVFLII